MNLKGFGTAKALILCLPFALSGGLLACSEENTTGTHMNSLDESEEDDESSSSKEKSSSSEDKGAEKQSSSSKKSSDGEKDASSSSKDEESSSSGFEISKTPSSSSLLAMNSSSSGTLVPRKPFGTCAPSNLTAEKDQAVTWDFTWDLAGSGVRVLDALKAEYSWNLPGGTPSTAEGAHSTSVTATYSTTGAKTASVSVSVNGEEQTIDCSPLNVNGIPITGCECASTNTKPDVAAGESATWTAKGCTSNANIMGYSWTGATADATGLVATAPVAAKDDVVSGVSFTVENDDNTKVIVPCEDAVAVGATLPDYVFRDSGSIPENGIYFEGDIDADVVFDLPEGWHSVGGNCTFVCKVERGSGGSYGDGWISGTLGTYEFSGGDFVTTQIPVSITMGGNVVAFKLNVGTNVGATCGVAW